MLSALARWFRTIFEAPGSPQTPHVPPAPATDPPATTSEAKRTAAAWLDDLQSVFSGEELDAIRAAELCPLLDWILVPRVVAMLRAQNPDGSVLPMQVSRDYEFERENARKLGAVFAEVLLLAVDIDERLADASTEEMRALRARMEGYFDTSREVGRILNKRGEPLEIEYRTEEFGPPNRVVAFMHCVEILRHMQRLFLTKVLGSVPDWTSFERARDAMRVTGTMKDRARVVAAVASVLKAVTTENDIPLKRHAADLVESLCIVDPQFDPLAEQTATIAELLARSSKGKSKAPRAPYVAAAASIMVGWLGDRAEEGESVEAARRRISNIFRNAANAHKT